MGSYYRTYETSPLFPKKNPEIAAASSWAIDYKIEFPQSQKFLPLNTIQVINNSSVDIALHTNHSSTGKVIAAGTSITFDKGTIPAIWGFTIRNLSGSAVIPADKIEITSWREAIEVSEAFRKVHKAIYKLFYGFR